MKYSWSVRHPDRRRETSHKRRLKIRAAILEAYGNSKCARCGCTDTRVLDLDHIGGGGNTHRRQLGANVNFYNTLYIQGFPDKDKYRILCRNCNWIAYLEQKEQRRPVQYSGRNKWPTSVMIRAVELVTDGRKPNGVGAKEAIAKAVEEYNATAEKKIAPSKAYQDSNASGILWAFKKRLQLGRQ